jgi:hypothetical protein
MLFNLLRFAEYGFKASDIFLWLGMLSQEDDGPEADTWFTRGNGSSSSVITWLQLSDFFSHLHMHNLCITAALQGLRLVSDNSPHSFRLRLCLHVSESHSNLGNVNESIRFINVAVQDIRSNLMRSKRRKDKRASISSNPVDDDVSTLTQAFERYNIFPFQQPPYVTNPVLFAGTSKRANG